MTRADISLRTKLIIALAAMALIPLFLANFLTLRTAEQAIMKVVFERNRNLAENIAGDIDDMFAEKIRMLKIAVDNTDIRSMDAGRMVPALSHIPANHPALLMAIVLAPNGDLLARSDGKPPAKANYSDREYFRTAARTGQVTISDVLVSKTTGKLDIGIAEPINNADKTLRGMLVIGVSLQNIIDRIAGTRIGTAGYAYIVNKTGKVLIHADRSLTGNSADFSGLPPVKAAISGQTGWMDYEFHGRKMLAGYSYVPTTGWGLVVQQPLADAMAAATRLKNTNILIMVVTVFVAVVIAFALAGVIFKPIALLTNAAKKVAEGDLATQANFESSDGIGTLATAFNDMTRQLRTREEALHRSQEQYRRIVDTSSEGIAAIDKDQRFTFVNARMSKMLGYATEEMIGRELESFIFNEDLPDHGKQMENRLQGMAGQYERRWKHRDGHAVWTNISATPILDAQHHFDGSFGMITDITERKKAEDALKKSEAHYRSLFDNSLIGVSVTDKNFVITEANDALCKMLEYSREELVGKMTISDVSHPDDVMESMDMINRLQRHDIDHFSLEKCYVSKTGKTIPALVYVRGVYSLDGEYEGTTASILDITETKKAVNLLHESNEKFTLAFNNAPINIAISNLDNGLYLDVNQRFLDTFGCSREEVIGRSSLELGLITNAQRKRIIEVIEEKGAIEELDLVMFSKSGKEILFKYWGNSIMVSNQRRLLSLFLDITEHRKIEQQLQQAQKMESVGRLAGGVAHDFNNMLGVILGHAEMAMDKMDPNQPLFADLEEIRKAASRSADLTRQLLAFARKQTVAPKILDLNETIEGMLKMLRRLIGEDIDLVWMPGAGLWPVKIDPSQMDQILANLCVNARDAIAGVGKIIVETGNDTLDNEYCTTHPEAIPGEYVRISVSDTGCGMDKLMLAHIFEPFFTTKGVGAGTGLGLATVYGAVKQNDGFIYVYSEPGQGSIFTIYLPRHQDMGATGQVIKEGAARHAVGGHETILLVEDELSILKMTKMMLQRLGYIVIAAGTPTEAIRLAEDFVFDIHLLMTDVIMPEMNGRDLADRLMTVKKGMKCLFMSGYTSEIIANQGVLVEGMHFIQKPFSQKELAVRIREALNAEGENFH
jgi:PAS domain S-box-containing protein